MPFIRHDWGSSLGTERATYVLDQGALVLEGVTLAGVVQLVVQVLVDLSAGTVLDEEAAEDAQAAHPEDLRGHTGVGGTLSLTVATVSAFSSGEVQLAGSGSRVHGDGLADDEAIGDELSDRLARVGVGDLVLLIGVEPDLALAAADDRRGKALLSSQVDPGRDNRVSPCDLVRVVVSSSSMCIFNRRRLPPSNRAFDPVGASQKQPAAVSSPLSIPSIGLLTS